MSTTKTLALAAFAAMSLGIGAAMAQTDGPSAPDPNYGPAQQYYVGPSVPMTVRSSIPVQAGSSDVDTTRAAAPATVYDNGDLANPG
jgi:hypothetical protein